MKINSVVEMIKIFNTLAFKLFLLIFSIMLVGTVIFSTLIIKWQTERCLTTATENVLKMSDLIRRATHYSMLHNRREDIYQIINMAGSQPGIEVIRIYNKKGEITFSTIEGEVGMRMPMESEACNVCHMEDKVVAPVEGHKLVRMFKRQGGNETFLGVINPIRNENSCYSADCHAHTPEQTILGVLDVVVSIKDIERNLAVLREIQYASGFLLLLILSGFVWLFIWKMVNVPIRKLMYGTQEIIRGNLDYRIDIKSKDEIGQLAESFNSMTENLKQAHQQLLDWAHTLEQRVAEKAEELRRAQAHIVQIEKMVSLGKLAATVAHELNNPLEGILTYAKLLKRQIQNGKLDQNAMEEILNELSLIIDETSRCGNIVKNLLLFSKQKIGDFKDEDLKQIIKRVIELVDHHLKMNEIKFELEAPDEPVMFFCDAQQIEQALLAMIVNSIEAMPQGGTLRIETRSVNEGNEIEIKISDTGVGIREEDLPHIFEPFFTTKKEGKGTGLGLAVVYGIVERHNGKIWVESKVNQGTTFTIRFPRK